MFEEKNSLNPEMYSPEDIQQVTGGTAANGYEPAANRSERTLNTATAEQLLNSQIQPGETVLWQGKPEVLRRFKISPLIVFATMWLGFVILSAIPMMVLGLVLSQLGDAAATVLNYISILPLALAGICFLCPGFLLKIRYRNTAYAITDQRIISVDRKRISAWKLDNIMKIDANAQPDGSGDLTVTVAQVEKVKEDGEIFCSSRSQIELRGLKNVEQAENMLVEKLRP